MDIEQPKPKIKQVIPTQKNPLSNESLQNFLSGNDLEQFEEYINTQFSNLSQEELLSKLMGLDEITRIKLLNLIMQYKNKTPEAKQQVNQVNNNQNNPNNQNYQNNANLLAEQQASKDLEEQEKENIKKVNEEEDNENKMLIDEINNPNIGKF